MKSLVCEFESVQAKRSSHHAVDWLACAWLAAASASAVAKTSFFMILSSS
jgi:hypothetical protein